MTPYQIDAFRFKKNPTNYNFSQSPYIHMIQTTMGHIRVLDSKEGKEVLLIIPDGPNIIEHYKEIVSELGKTYRLVIFDLPGFGFSIHNGSYDYSFGRTNELINELLDTMSIPQVNIIFPCANGFYGLSFAHSYPEKVKHLMLLQTPSLTEMGKWSDRIVPSFLKRPYLSQMIMPFMEKTFADKWYDYALPKGIDRAPYKETALNGLKHGGAFCLCSLTQGLMTQLADPLEIDPALPMTLIHGDKDFTHKGTDFQSIQSYQKQVDIITFEGCGHFPDLERTDAFIQIVKEKI
ncbi:MAG: alpha/beta hydrolase [Bacteroidota bacterium]